VYSLEPERHADRRDLVESGPLAPDGTAYDYVLVGGGLQNGLLALAILAERPEARLALVERAQTLGGNHTWCFHAGDLPASAAQFVGPLIAQRWPGYEVAFRDHRRTLESPYAAITSARFDQVVQERLNDAPGAELWLGCEAKVVGAHEVELGDGRRLTGRMVVDARGPEQSAGAGAAQGYQKFVGLELRLRRPHARRIPMLMDATLPQDEGFRFMYVLPLGPERLLVEDTYVTDAPFLDRGALRGRVLRYAAEQGWEIEAVEREESGVLPLPWKGRQEFPLHGPLLAGYQGGWFHPVTGYSFPIALRLACALARAPLANPRAALKALARAQRAQRGYCQFLNRMFFCWYPPEQRHHVLARFYRLPEPTIRRFYALALSAGDRLRILVGRPPRGLSLRRALGRGSAR
jgi:lycopene beta-cyclase